MMSDIKMASANITSSSSSSSSSSSLTPHPNNAHLTLALVCQSNFNRSMAAHQAILLEGLTSDNNIFSYGVGTKVRLPGESINRPLIYDFGTPYRDIHRELKSKNVARYSSLTLYPLFYDIHTHVLSLSPSLLHTHIYIYQACLSLKFSSIHLFSLILT